jgi:membrane protease YdiL (CAAX protease family)
MLSEKPWKPERAALLLLGMFVGISFFTMLGAVAQHYHGEKSMDEDSPLYVLLVTLSIHGSVLVATGLVLWWYRINPGQAFGFSTPGRTRAVLTGALAAVLFLPAGWLLQGVSEKVMDLLHRKAVPQEAIEMLQKTQTPDSRAYLIVFAVLIAPVAEEIFFRGVLYPAIKQAGWPRAAWWGTATLFAAIHGSLPIFLPLLALGLALVWLYELTDNLLAPIAAHGVFNGINVLMFYFGDDLVNLLHRGSAAHP